MGISDEDIWCAKVRVPDAMGYSVGPQDVCGLGKEGYGIRDGERLCGIMPLARSVTILTGSDIRGILWLAENPSAWKFNWIVYCTIGSIPQPNLNADRTNLEGERREAKGRLQVFANNNFPFQLSRALRLLRLPAATQGNDLLVVGLGWREDLMNSMRL